MTENKDNAEMLGLLLDSLPGQTALATLAHQSLAIEDVAITTPEKLSGLATELSVSARETVANAASAPSVAGRQLDYLHAQSGALVDQCERYIAQVRQRRENILHTQHVTAIAYTGFEAGLKAESEAHQLSARVVVLESFILTIKAVAHQSVAAVTTQMCPR